MLALMFVGLVFNAIADDDLSRRYFLDTGDVLKINVFGEPDLSSVIKVSEYGTIAFPFLGELNVVNKTTRHVEGLIVEGLKGPYLVNPKVSVSIDQYRPFYINGQVDSPGSFPYQPGMTVRKAISLAGGFTERASRNKIYIQHKNQTNEQRQRVSIDAPVVADDVVTISESFF